MPNGISDSTNALSADGQSLILDFKRISDTSATLTWSVPSNSKTYNGALLILSTQELNPSNYPTDGVTYLASPNVLLPQSKIGVANVVGVFYNDLTTRSITLTGLDPTEVYFCSVHLITNTNAYYTFGVKSYSSKQQTEIYAGDIQKLYAPPINPLIGHVYFDENQKLTFVWDGESWSPTSTHTTLTAQFDPGPTDGQTVGDFYYNTKTKTLKVWTGVNVGWVNAESSNAGTPMYAKPSVGTDHTYDERAGLIDVLKKQLGYPVVCVELTEDHFNIAIDNALMEFRRRVDTAYYQQFFFMTLQPNQEKYYLNDPALGTAKIVDVLKINRLTTSGLSGVSAGSDPVYAQSFLNQLYSPAGGFDLVSVHLMHSLSKMYNLLFAGDVSYNWREAPRELTIYKRFHYPEKVLVEASCEKTEQELLLDRYAQQWIQAWAESEAMLILGRIRGKFSSMPGPGGSLSMNADSLISEANTIQTELLRQIMDFEVGQNSPGGFQNSSFIIG